MKFELFSLENCFADYTEKYFQIYNTFKTCFILIKKQHFIVLLKELRLTLHSFGILFTFSPDLLKSNILLEFRKNSTLSAIFYKPL